MDVEFLFVLGQKISTFFFQKGFQRLINRRGRCLVTLHQSVSASDQLKNNLSTFDLIFDASWWIMIFSKLKAVGEPLYQVISRQIIILVTQLPSDLGVPVPSLTYFDIWSYSWNKISKEENQSKINVNFFAVMLRKHRKTWYTLKLYVMAGMHKSNS